MEFKIDLKGGQLELAAFEDELLQLDPAAVFAVAGDGQALSVSAWLEISDLVALLHKAGYPATTRQVVQLPSICCGSCT